MSAGGSIVRTTRIGLGIVVSVLVVMGLSASCDPPRGSEVEYRPMFLPVKFTYDGSKIDVTGEKEIVTFIGTFTIGAKYPPPGSDPGTIYVIIRNRGEPPAGYDHTYQVWTGGGKFSVLVNGKTAIQVVDRQVLIDVTDSEVEDIQFTTVPPAESNPVSHYRSKWDEYWDWSYYTPFSLFTCAYDDSTISEGYGAGFVWFSLRLLLALFLLIFDLLLTTVLLAGGLAYVIFGAGARNFVVFGFFALLGVAAVVGVVLGRP